MWNYFEPELRRRLTQLTSKDSYSTRVRCILMELLPSGECSIEEVAKMLYISKRTLQRKLREENTSFQKQLNYTRELLAKSYIRNKSLSTDDIAFLLGYKDMNSFQRAFNCWTGMNITEFKKTV